jgi:SAM-dependent methyltransferase
MNQPLPFKPHRFRLAASHYLAGRAAYSPALIRRVATACGLSESHRMLDLGCGPGQLSIAFSTWVGSVLAVDPEPGMLEVATELAASMAPNVSFMQGSSYDLSPALGSFRLAVMGRSFHWMDRPETLRRLDALLEPGGAVVLFGTNQPPDPGNAWLTEYRRILDSYADQDPARATRKTADWISHDDVLLDSAFCHLESVAFVERRRVPVQRLLDRPLSMSSMSRERLGAQLDEMIAELSALVTPHSRDGMVDELVKSTALIARRRAV